MFELIEKSIDTKKETKKLVIYLMSYPFTKKDFTRFGVQQWIKNNWKVKIFNVSYFVNKKLFQYVKKDDKILSFKQLLYFKNYDSILSAINNLSNDVVFVDLLGNSIVERNIRKAAHNHGVMILLNLGFFPQAKIQRDFIKLLILLIFYPVKFLKKTVNFLINIKNYILVKNDSPDYIVVGGNKSLMKSKNKNSKIIKAHNFDYDLIIQKKNKNLQNRYKKKYLVFLDEYEPYHSDRIIDNRKPYVTPNRYFKVIDKGLNKIGKILNLDVKIAAHPKSNYKNKKIKYNQKIIKNETFELIKNAKLVVGHASTSLQLAVIMKKPIILVTTDEILNETYAKNYSKMIDSFAEALDKKVINLSCFSDFYDPQKYLAVNDQVYKKYKETYIKTSNSPERPIWDIVIKKIDKDFLEKKY